MMSEQEFYLSEKSEEIAPKERQFDAFIEHKKPEKSSFFLQKMREIIFCRNKGLPTKQKEKDIRAYRDADVAVK